MVDFVPSEKFPNGLTALENLLDEATSVSAAIAFVTSTGVARLAELLASHPEVELEIAGAAPQLRVQTPL